MTLNEAKEIFWAASRDGKAGVFEKAMDIQYTKVVSSYYIGSEFDKFIEKIYSDFKLELEAEYQRGRDSILSRTCKSCKHKYIVDSMTTECRDNDSPIDYLDLECFPEFSCNKWEQK